MLICYKFCQNVVFDYFHRESSTVDSFMFIHIHAQSSQFSNFKANPKLIPNPLLLHQYLTCECQTKFNFEPKKKHTVRKIERDEKSLILTHESYPPLTNDRVQAHAFFFFPHNVNIWTQFFFFFFFLINKNFKKPII